MATPEISIPTAEEWAYDLDGILMFTIGKSALDNDELDSLAQIHAYIIKEIERNIPRYPDVTHIYVQRFHYDGGSQIVAHGAFENKNSPFDMRKMNFHGQNTSQMLWGFGVVFEIETRKFWTNSI